MQMHELGLQALLSKTLLISEELSATVCKLCHLSVGGSVNVQQQMHESGYKEILLNLH